MAERSYDLNDYRKYAGNTSSAYDLSAFEVERKVKPQPGYVPKHKPLTEVDERPKTNAEKALEEKMGLATALKTIAVAVVLFIIFGVMVNTYVQKNELNQEIIHAQKELSTAQTEYNQLMVNLNSMASEKKVVDYAVNELGMVKLQNNQTFYVSVAQPQNGSESGDTGAQE